MKSIWLENSKFTNFPVLEKDITVDICIIGAGITGLTTAYLLNKERFLCLCFRKRQNLQSV